jgi:hypothetical protein
VALGAFDAAVSPQDPPTASALVALVLRARPFLGDFLHHRAGRRRDDPHGRRNPTLRDGLDRQVVVGCIFGYAVIAATVGLLLQALSSASAGLRFVIKLIGVT